MKRFYPDGSNFFLADNNPEFNRLSESVSVEIVQEALSGSVVGLFDGLGLIVDSIAFLLSRKSEDFIFQEQSRPQLKRTQ